MWVWVILLALHTQTGTITPSHPQARTLSEISERGFVEGVRSETRWTCRKRSSRAWFKLPLSDLPWEDPTHPKRVQMGLGALAASLRCWEGKRRPEKPRGSPGTESGSSTGGERGTPWALRRLGQWLRLCSLLAPSRNGAALRKAGWIRGTSSTNSVYRNICSS